MSLLVTAVLAWLSAASAPEPRSEVAAAVIGGEIAVVGGLTEDGAPSSRVEAYSPKLDRWRRLPDLPVGVHHAMIASDSTRLYVVGGYGGPLGVGGRLRGAFAFDRGAWRALPRLSEPRAAGGAAVIGGRLYVVGGVGASGLARRAFALDLRTRRWMLVPAPSPREHLAVTATAPTPGLTVSSANEYLDLR
jgi:non-specific serine/threonine protein kinase